MGDMLLSAISRVSLKYSALENLMKHFYCLSIGRELKSAKNLCNIYKFSNSQRSMTALNHLLLGHFQISWRIRSSRICASKLIGSDIPISN